jgi:hypothetical protein
MSLSNVDEAVTLQDSSARVLAATEANNANRIEVGHFFEDG